MDVKKKKKIWILLLSFMVLVALFGSLWFSRLQEFSIKLWVPEKAHFANLVAEEGYAPVEKVSVSGTAIFVPLEQYQERFSHNDQAMIVQENGDVYYITKTDKETYVSVDQNWSSPVENPLRKKKVAHVDFEGIATIHIVRSWNGVGTLIVGLFLIWAVVLIGINKIV